MVLVLCHHIILILFSWVLFLFIISGPFINSPTLFLSVWQVYSGGSPVSGPDRSWLHLDRVQSDHWQPRLYPWGRPYAGTGGTLQWCHRTSHAFHSRLFQGCCHCLLSSPKLPTNLITAHRTEWITTQFENIIHTSATLGPLSHIECSVRSSVMQVTTHPSAGQLGSVRVSFQCQKGSEELALTSSC